MKKLKRTLALTLVLCMLCSLLPVSVLAAETAPTNNLSTTGSPFKTGTGDSNSFRIPALVTLSDGTLLAAADARWNTTYDGGGLDTMIAISEDDGATWTHSFANYLGDNGNAYNSASSCFIDPSLAVYTTDVNNDGTGEDTIYMLCDLYPNGVALNGAKQCTPSTQTGFNASGYLKLTTVAPSTSGNNYIDSDFTHYLKDGNIYSNDGTPVSGLSVDDYFNVTGTYNNQTVSSNLFFADSPFHVVRTGFLYLTKSTDGGENWSAPELLNLKTSSEMVCLVGPNGGMVTTEGVIVFPVYSYNSSTEQTGLIYSDDEGATWKRSPNFTGSTSKSSEADVVELDNGKLRVFYRNTSSYLCYADYDLSTNTWGNQVNTRVFTNSNTELSAITYSKSVIHNGVEKTVILVSCPASANLAGSTSSDGSWRTSGRIFAGLVDPETFEMTWLDNSVQVTPVATSQLSDSTYTAAQGFFAYSSMTETLDGDVAILYEDNQYGWGAGNGYSYTLDFKTYSTSELEAALGVSFVDSVDVDIPGDGSGDDSSDELEITMSVGDVKTDIIEDVFVDSGSTSTDEVDVHWVGTKTNGGTAEQPVLATLPTSSGSIQAYISDGKGNYLTNNGYNLTNTTSVANATKWTIIYEDTPTWDTNTNNMSRYNIATTINGLTYYIDGNFTLNGVDSNNNFWHTADHGFFGNFSGTNGWQYANGAWSINSSGYGNANAYTVETVTTEGTSSTEVTFTAKAAGETEVTIGPRTYNITVTPVAVNVTETVNVEIEVGENSQVYTNTTGSTVVQNTDSTIATMAVNEVAGHEASYTAASNLESGSQYLITFGGTYILTSTPSTGYNGSWGNSTGLLMTSNTANQEQYLWTVTKSGDGYTFMNANRQYLNVAAQNNTVSLSNTPVVLSVIDNGSTFTIHNNNYCLNNFGGSNVYASCWDGTTDPNASWTLKKYTPAVTASTEVSFTGMKAGKTTAVVGTTQYNITVTPVYEKVNVELMVGTSKTYTHTTGNEVITSPNQGIAKMDIATNMTISPVTKLESGKQYIIANTKTGKVLTDSVIKIPGKWDDKTGLAVSDDLSANCAELWTVTVTEDGRYTISQNGKYLVASGYYADMSTTATGLNVAYNTEKQAWTIMDNVTKEAPTEYFLSANVGDNYEGGVLATSATNNEYIYWAFYEVVPANTEITFTGVSVGQTVAVVGNTKYNITVTPGYAQKDVMLKVGQSTTYSDDSGVYDSYTITDPSIVDVHLEGGTKPTAMTSITANDTFYIMVSEGVYLTKDYGTTTKLEEAETWTVVTDGGYYYVIKNSDGLFLGDQRNGGPVSVHTGYGYMDFNDGVLVSYYSSTYVGIPVKATSTNTSGTNITFTAKAEGRTTVVVGKTQYNITVVPDSISSVVKIELEVGESYTYTDTTGNHSANIIQQPNGAYASMTVTGSANSIQKKLVPVNAATFTANKRYVIENVRAKGNQAAHSVLTSEDVTYGYTGLIMNGPLDPESSPTWIITPDDNHYLVSRNNEYLTFSDYYAATSTSSTQIDLNYVEGQGWTITYNGFYLSDRGSTESGEAFGSTSTEDGIYWNIYELVTEQLIDATKVVFEGEAVGTTTAIVGSTQYIITVVPVEVDDEVQNTATNIWTVDPEIQRERYNSLIGLHKDLFTDASWKVYETARQAAYKKLVEVTNAQYSSAEDAEAALAELTKLIDQLVTAKAQLESAKTISVRYTLNGQDLDIREYKIGANDKTATLPDTIVVNNIAYKVTITELDLTGETGSGDTAFEVPVTVIGKLGGGFVGSQDITAGNHNGHAQVCDLVDDSNTGKKITEMTLTTGISYDLNLATDTTGMTVTWTTDNSSVATVDQNGNVTAVGTGTTNITATITDANGNVVEVNTIPVTVFPKGTADRKTAIYIEGIDNTTVWCVVNGDTTNYGFEVIEGELIYGQFDTTVSDGTKTTAMSFFGDPDEAHALVYMKSTNSDDHYFLLHDDDGNTYDGSQSGKASDKYYVSGVTSGAGWWQAVGLNDNTENNTPAQWKIVYDMVDWAVDLGCDGGLGFTRRKSEGALASNLTFASDPMPRIEKVVDGVLPTSRKQADYERYTPNMVAAVNELVYFKITITQEVPSVWDDAAQTIGAINYQNAWVTDTILPGAYLYNKELDQADGTWDGEVAESSRTQKDDITDELKAAWTEEQKAAGKRIFEYYLVYEIQESDIPKFYIDNIANLSYNYGSKYSKGAQAGTADAEARITVVGSAIDNVVIDFGQTVVYQGHDFTSITDGKSYTFTGLRNVHLKGAYVNGVNDIAGITKCHAEANYGEVEVTRTQLKDENGQPMYDSKGYPEYEYIVTYTPTTILQGADAVRIYGMGENNQEKVINGFLVYPATTVYYEEGFMLDNNSSWDAVNGWSSNPGWDTTNAKGATVNQSFELLGMSQFDNHGMLTGKISNLKHNYGFDPIYDGSTANGEAAKSWITADKVGDSTSFTFTGTGFELFADCTENSGYVNVTVVNAEGQNVKVFMVNTVVKGGDSSATTGQTGDMDSLPIVSLKDLPHGTYTVTLGKVMNDSKVVTIDGVRITNTLADSSVYTIDEEDNPEFYQLRDMVLHSLDIKADTSDDYGNMTDKAHQVYNDLFFSDAETEEPFAIITSTSEIYDSNDTQDLLDKGPKNEVYLWAEQTLTFNVKTSRLMQVGLKAPRGATSYTIKVDNNVVKSADLETTVDLFYELGNTNGTEHTYTISITNTGSDILAITDLKICDDPNAKFEHITYDNIVDILEDAGYYDGDAPEVPEEPEVPEVPEQPDVPMQFVDVPEGAYYYPPVVWAVKNGITNGISQSHFGSEMDCNRAQVVTFLWRAAGCPEPTITENPFVDVEAGSFYEKAVLWAVEMNITNGTDKTHFSPNLTCNRASVVTFLYRAFEEPVVEDVENPFTDVPAETWFTQPVLWAVEQEITNGIGGGLFGIDDVCNRAQIVTFLYRAYN